MKKNLWQYIRFYIFLFILVITIIIACNPFPFIDFIKQKIGVYGKSVYNEALYGK